MDRGRQPAIGSAPLAAAGRTGTRSQPLRTRFPARPVAASWPQTRLPGQSVLQRLGTAPFVADTAAGEDNRRRGVRMVVDWLQTQPGDTWQQRWLASGADHDGRLDWRGLPIRWRKATTSWDCRFDTMVLGTGLLSLMCADVLRPGLAWLLTTATPKRLAAEMARTRDPVGFAELTARCQANPVGESTTRVALHRIAVIMAAKGGAVADITVGDCIELLDVAADVCTLPHHKSPYFYQVLHALGVLGNTAAPTVRALSDQRQLSVEQLVDRCGIQCRPVRDLLVDYLRERQVSVDHVTLVRLADTLGRLFWRDLELRHPGIDSLRLAPAVAAGWKQRVGMKTTRRSAGRRQRHRRPQSPSQRHELPVHGADVLPRHRPVGHRRSGAVGTVGRPLPDQGRGDSPPQGSRPPQVPHGSADPRTTARCCPR